MYTLVYSQHLEVTRTGGLERYVEFWSFLGPLALGLLVIACENKPDKTNQKWTLRDGRQLQLT
jgi:hypothetical protein